MTGSLRRTVVAAVATLLGAIVLTAVVRGGPWVWQTAGAVVLVAGLGWGLRRVRLPRLVVPLAQGAALASYLTVLFASGSAVLGVLPAGSALQALRGIAEQGVETINEQAAPVPAEPGIALLVVAGVGLVAIAVDLIAAAYGRAALGGLPLLAIYSVPATTLPGGVSGWLFLGPAVGFLALLLADGRERLLRWGRPVAEAGAPAGAADGAAAGDPPTQVVRSRDPVTQLGRRIGLTALAVAVVVPAVLPGLSEGVLAEGRFGTGGGGGTIATLNPLVSLRRDLLRSEDVEVLRVRTDAAEARDLYLRTVTLDTFDGQDWRASSREVETFDRELPPAEGLGRTVPKQQVASEITASRSIQSDYLPLPYPAAAVEIDGTWRVDPATQNVVSQAGRKQISGRRYTVDSLAVSPTRESLAAAPAVRKSRYLALPAIPASVRATAAEVTAGAGDPLATALAIQDWLRDPDNFTYDISARSGTGTAAIEEFLRDRRGYCEQFAATMAVFARLSGIPSRVNVGFTPGALQPDGSRLVTAHDAHAWPELFFPGTGWVRFEPTPPDSTADPSVPAFLAPPSAPDTATTTPTAQPSPTTAPTGAARPDRADREDPLAAPESGGSSPWPWIAAGLAVAAAAAAPAAVAALVRRRRWTGVVGAGGQAEAAWADLLESAANLGYGKSAAETPRGWTARLIGQAGLRRHNAESLTRVARAVERSRYAAGDGTAADLRPDVERVRTALSARVSARTRAQALLFPASGRAALAGYAARAAERFAGVVDRIALARARVVSYVGVRLKRVGTQVRDRLLPRHPVAR